MASRVSVQWKIAGAIGGTYELSDKEGNDWKFSSGLRPKSQASL